MKVKTISENLLELFALNANLIPLPIIHTQVYPLLAKAIMDAHSLDIFEVFKDEPLSLDEAVSASNLDRNALSSMLRVLNACDYLAFKNNKFHLTPLSRKWCLKDSPDSLYHMQRYNQVTWHWLNHLESFIQTGEALSFHDHFNPAEWALYQKGMASIAVIVAKFITRVGPKLNKPQRMLDIGGSHGLFSLEYVKKYPTLHATILDLPQAVDSAEPLLRQKYTGDRIDYVRGNALTDSFGKDEYDIIFVASLMHHFTVEENTALCTKINTALKKNGFFVIHEFLRGEEKAKAEMIPSVMDLFFNLSSHSGGWSAGELVGFQTQCGLQHIAIKKFWSVPGLVQVIAQKI